MRRPFGKLWDKPQNQKNTNPWSRRSRMRVDMCRQDAGGYVPEQIAQAISDNQGVIDDAVRMAYSNTQEMINQTFGEGGIFDQPHIARFAEKGPEAAIPLDGLRNTISLWEKTGELLGMNGLTGGGKRWRPAWNRQ